MNSERLELDIIDEQHQRDADLYSLGKRLQVEYDSLDKRDVNQTDEFFFRLSAYDEKALTYYSVCSRDEQKSEVSTVHNEAEDSIKLSRLVEMFIDDRKQKWEKLSSLKTEQTVRGRLQLFLESVGDISGKALTDKHIRDFYTTVIQVPSRRKVRRKYKSKSLIELLAMDIVQDDKLSLKTKKEYLLNVCHFLKWASVNRYVERHLADILQYNLKDIKSVKQAYEERQVFDDDDLKALFNSKEYLEGKHRKESNYWVTLLALFTGARLSELCQLHVDDVKKSEVGEIWYLDINDLEDKKLKTKAARRQIPIHHQIIELGFLDYVKSKKRSRLFDDLSRNKLNDFKGFSRWFSTYKKRCGVGLSKEEGKVFHCFRHTFIDKYKQEGDMGDFWVVEEMVGHAAQGSESFVRYGKGATLEKKNEVLQKLEYKAIDFKKIKSWKTISRR